MALSMNVAVIGLVVSVASLLISGITFWLTVVRRGRLAATMPSIIFFGFDNIPKPTAKVFLRTLLYSTASQGQVVESMYVVLQRRDGVRRTFSFWGYDEGAKLVPGSGLYVSRSGVAANHHFVLSAHEEAYQFDPSDYTIELFARLVANADPVKLSTIEIGLSIANAHMLGKGSGILFERLPETGEYIGHVNSDREFPKPVPNG